MPSLSGPQLTRIAPSAPQPNVWVTLLNAAMERYAIHSRERMAAFLAQVAHESSELRRLEESLVYRSAARIRAVWPKRFASDAAAAPYVNEPQKLANFVYANRMGNGGVASGDGWRYRGRGLMQVTGRSNYDTVGLALKIDLLANPDRLLEPKYAALSAARYWNAAGLNELADHRPGDNDAEDFDRISIKINGGKNGLVERRRYWRLARDALGLN